MSLLTFVKSLPSDFVCAPIYKKGSKLISGTPSKGKTPLEDSHHRKYTPADAVLAMRQNYDLQAIGLWTGIRGNGYVILDIDAELKIYEKLWGDDLATAPKITSTKKNAAKFVFKIPSDRWTGLRGFGLGDRNYEILWGRQGVLKGLYPGHERTNTPEGEYTLVGDLHNVPDAPEWLIAEMKEKEDTNIIKKDIDFTDRTQDEIAQIISDCVSVIPQKGTGSRDHWVRVGMAIHSVLPNDMGLHLWASWSSEDPDYAKEWEQGNPCKEVFYSFKSKSSGIGLGTLIWLADREDPERKRFTETVKKIVEEAEARFVQETRLSVPKFEDLIKEAKDLLDIDNPAEMNYKLNALSLRAGYRDQQGIEKLLIDQMKYENSSEIMTIESLMNLEVERAFTVPDILPSPFTVLLFGSGGDGKSMSAWSLAKHVATGSPFLVRGKYMPVQKGPVLLLNGDQSMVQLKEQLEDIEYPMDTDTYILGDWSLQNYAKFIKLMDAIKPKLVIIDSLIGCSGGKGFDENKSDFATPLYWLTQNNGTLWEPTSILIIHHANKNGGFRGTSAIRDGVDETWALKKPDDNLVGRVGSNARIIEVEKSRIGRSGLSLIMKMEDDLTYSISDFTPEIASNDNTPANITDKILQRIRSVHPETRSKYELLYDPLIGGKTGTIRKSLQRLEKRGLIEFVEEDKEGKKYRAILARGDSMNSVPPTLNDNDSKDNGTGQGDGTPNNCPTSVDDGTLAK